MEPFIADLINNPKIPKWLRYVIVTLTCGFVVFLGIMLALQSPMLVGKIFGGALSVLFLSAAVYLLAKIAKSRRKKIYTR